MRNIPLTLYTTCTCTSRLYVHVYDLVPVLHMSLKVSNSFQNKHIYNSYKNIQADYKYNTYVVYLTRLDLCLRSDY